MEHAVKMQTWLRKFRRTAVEKIDSQSVWSETWLHVPDTGETVLTPGANQLLSHVAVAIHPLSSNTVVVMLPGLHGSVGGYEDKYAKIGDFIREKQIGAVVRTGNHPVPYLPYERAACQQLRAVLRRVLSESSRICGHSKPQLYLMGFSAGASVMAAVAHEFEEVARMLLIAPSADAGPQNVRAGIEAFLGDLAVAVGADDEVVRTFPQTLFDGSNNATRKRQAVIPHCDHQFRGETNGRILSHAPLWAFADDDPFPDPNRGIFLYE
jgi:alpha-beta hydrolase superfamily lysophospholipase